MDMDAPRADAVVDPFGGGMLMGVRLPLDEIEAIEREAQRLGVSPEQFLHDLIGAAFAKLPMPPDDWEPSPSTDAEIGEAKRLVEQFALDVIRAVAAELGKDAGSG
jgi:hypothetical protein